MFFNRVVAHSHAASNNNGSLAAGSSLTGLSHASPNSTRLNIGGTNFERRPSTTAFLAVSSPRHITWKSTSALDNDHDGVYSIAAGPWIIDSFQD